MGKVVWHTYVAGLLAGIAVTLGTECIIISMLVASGVLH